MIYNPQLSPQRIYMQQSLQVNNLTPQNRLVYGSPKNVYVVNTSPINYLTPQHNQQNKKSAHVTPTQNRKNQMNKQIIQNPRDIFNEIQNFLDDLGKNLKQNYIYKDEVKNTKNQVKKFKTESITLVQSNSKLDSPFRLLSNKRN